MAILGIQLIAMFHLVATLCENGGPMYVMVKLKDNFVPPIIHLVF